jgi:hypothetical protein
MVGKIKIILQEEVERIEAELNQSVCFLTEENICESCLAPVLPTGKVLGGKMNFPSLYE